MALSGSFSASQRNGNETVRCDWSGVQNVSNNTTTITAKLYFTNKYAINIGSRTHTITINGTSYNITSGNITTAGEHYLGSASKTITHNSDGTKSISMSFNFSLKASLSGVYYEGLSQSSSVTLNTIPRASSFTLSASKIEFGKSITINIKKASSNFTHQLYYSFNGSSYASIAFGISTSYTWTVPLSLINKIPNATSAKITFKLYTFNGNTNIGSTTTNGTFTATVPSSAIPTISSITVTDGTALSSQFSGYVQNKSKAKISVSASGVYKSSIKSYSISVNGETLKSNNAISGVLKSSGTNTISVRVTDSRGRTSTTKTTTINVLSYSNPRASLVANRCNINGELDIEGEYAKIVANGTISSLNNLNTKKFILQYKLSSSDETHTIETYTESYTYNSEKIVNIGKDDTVVISLIATDSFGNASSSNNLGSAYTLLDFNKNGKGIALGKVSEEDGFDCNMNTRFRQNVRSDGDVIAGLGTTEQTSLLGLNTKVKNGALRINNHFSGITKSVAGDSWSTTIGTIAGTTKGEAILYAEATFSMGTYRKFIEIRKNGQRLARQECAYTTNNTTNAISICTISTVAPDDVFTAYAYNGSKSTKEITNCIFRMIQIGNINQ